MPRADHTILIVEDDPDISEALRDILCDEGYQAEAVGDGQAALNYLRSSPTPAVILLDWNMAPMSGPQFLAEVAKETVLPKIPIVLLSADVGVADKAKNPLVVAYLTKPINLETLFEIIARYCE